MHDEKLSLPATKAISNSLRVQQETVITHNKNVIKKSLYQWKIFLFNEIMLARALFHVNCSISGYRLPRQ